MSAFDLFPAINSRPASLAGALLSYDSHRERSRRHLILARLLNKMEDTSYIGVGASLLHFCPTQSLDSCSLLGWEFKRFPIARFYPIEPGVYIYRSEGEFLYIGEAGNLHSRLVFQDHPDRDDAINIHRADEVLLRYPIPNLAERKEFERTLITHYRPLLNQQHNVLP